MGCGPSGPVMAGNFVSTTDDLILSASEKILIKKSFQLIRDELEKVAVMMFLGVFEEHPECKELFVPGETGEVSTISNLIRSHGMRIMGLITDIVNSIDESHDILNTHIMMLGKKHVGYNAQPQLFEVFARQIRFAMQPILKRVWTQEVEDAWKHLFLIITTNLHKGYKIELDQISAQVP